MSVELPIIDLSAFPKSHASNAMSPFRYPGGKAFLTGLLQERLSVLPKGRRVYVEPFCGGAGAAINLLHQGAATHIVLNDMDVRIYSAWKAMLLENERFLESIERVPLDLSTWRKMREVALNPTNGYSFELGFATFYLNRTSRGGIILGSGPIGGYHQSGDWTIAARFYRTTLTNRVRWIGSKKSKIEIYNLPSVPFLKRISKRKELERYYVFIDPPYYEIGSRLYLNGMGNNGHSKLATYIQGDAIPNWIMTYDDHPIIRGLYAKLTTSHLMVQYSLQKRRLAKEILIEDS